MNGGLPPKMKNGNGIVLIQQIGDMNYLEDLIAKIFWTVLIRHLNLR